MKHATLLIGLILLGFTAACSDPTPPAATASESEPTQTAQPTNPTSGTTNGETDSSESVRTFRVEDIFPAEQNIEPATASEKSFPAYRAPEESDEITPVIPRATAR